MRRGVLAALALAALLAPQARAQESRAQENRAQENRRISVIGHAQAERAPDFAEVEVGVVARGRTPAAALDGASTAARGLIAAAKEAGVPEADIATTSLRLDAPVRQVRQPDGSSREQADGYEAGNRVRVRLADMGRLGELMRRMLDAGANRIDGVSFGLSDPDGAQATVQVAAMGDARAQAERLAQAAGVRLGPALSITAPPRATDAAPRSLAARAVASRAAVPIEAGSIALSAEVEAVFAILP